jgi:hypothetical protein
MCDDPAGLDPKYFRLCNDFNPAHNIVCTQFTPRRCSCRGPSIPRQRTRIGTLRKPPRATAASPYTLCHRWMLRTQGSQLFCIWCQRHGRSVGSFGIDTPRPAC